MIDLLYRTYTGLGGDRLAWQFSGPRLRILCYHGVCDDHLASKPWVPSYFVARSSFERQLRYLKQHAVVLPLSEAVRRLQAGTLPPRAVSITFDDGYANNLHVAMPLLNRYEAHASIFLSTGCIESGEWYPFLKLKLLKLARPALALPDYKLNPLDDVLAAANEAWRALLPQLTVEQLETLRPMTVEEVSCLDLSLIELGGHSHTHCIASNESLERRVEEVRQSVRRTAAWSGRQPHIYSYPNGEPGDFGAPEKESLRGEGVAVAVTGIAGSNTPGQDPLELHRYPITMGHGDERFRAELTGLPTVLRATWTRKGS